MGNPKEMLRPCPRHKHQIEYYNYMIYVPFSGWGATYAVMRSVSVQRKACMQEREREREREKERERERAIYRTAHCAELPCQSGKIKRSRDRKESTHNRELAPRIYMGTHPRGSLYV